MLPMVVAQLVCHELMFWLNDLALKNMLDMVLAEPVCHELTSWSKFVLKNM